MRLFLVLFLACASCSSESSTPSAPSTQSDGGVDGATAADVAVGDVETGGTCAFNRECGAADRCECTDGSCACRPGARGTGKNGVDACTSPNDCASSVCTEGSDGKSYCSDECVTDASCGAALPRCVDVSFVGRICVRIPPDAN